MPSPPTDPLIGQTLDDRYVVRARIARGGMAMVYMASDLRLERRVAVKVMHAHLADEATFVRRFEQEARSAARLAHPNVVNVFDQGHADGRAYLVMEYLPGITLRDLLKQQRRLTPEQAVDIADAVLAGLAAAHQADIVHRDLKPENVLLADDGRIKIGDFGLARAVSANTTTGQALLGTIAYLSPELVTRGIADARSDIYAFGIMMFEMLTGTQPFTGEQPMQIAYQHAHSDVPVPSSQIPSISSELDELVRWTTQRDPEARPRDAGIVLEQLRKLSINTSGLATTKVIPLNDHSLSTTTPATAVLNDAQRTVLSATPPAFTEDVSPLDPTLVAANPPPAEQLTATPSPIGTVRTAAKRRAKRGRLIAFIIVVFALIAGGLAFWLVQGPGSRVVVPDIAEMTIEEARATLAKADLALEPFECTSVATPEGLTVRSEPPAGSRIDRGTTVRVCQSIGPEQLPVPTLVGLTVQDAEQKIEDSGFTFGEVVERRFSDEPADVVIAALGADGEPLAEAYAEQARVDVVLSIGGVPNVAGMSVDEATDVLAGQELTVQDEFNTEAFSEDVVKGNVIRLLVQTDPVRPGDAVGLEVSQGPELFPIPDVSELRNVGEAYDALEAAGFKPQISGIDGLDKLAEPLLRRLNFDGTDPEAGSMLPRGSTVKILIL